MVGSVIVPKALSGFLNLVTSFAWCQMLKSQRLSVRLGSRGVGVGGLDSSPRFRNSS